jgi:hypothetical protein
MEIGEKSVRNIYDKEQRRYLDAEGKERSKGVRVNKRTQRVAPGSAEANQNLLKAFPDERVDRLIDIFNKKLNFSTFFYPNENKISGVDVYDQPEYLKQPGQRFANLVDGVTVGVANSTLDLDSEYSQKRIDEINRFFPIDTVTLANKPGVLYMDQDPVYLQNRTFNEFLFQEMLNRGLQSPIYEDYLQKSTEFDIDGNVIRRSRGYNNVSRGALATAGYSNIHVLPIDQLGEKKESKFSTFQHEKVHMMGYKGDYYDHREFNLSEPSYDQFLGALLDINRPGSGKYLSDNYRNRKLQDYVNRFPESGALYEEQRFVRGLGPNEVIPAWAEGEKFEGDDNIKMHSREQGMHQGWNDYLRKDKYNLGVSEKYWTQRDSITKQRKEFYNQIR